MGLHGVDNFEIGVFWFLEAYAFGSVGEVANLDSYFVILVDFDVLEDHFCGYDFEGLCENAFLFGGGACLY